MPVASLAASAFLNILMLGPWASSVAKRATATGSLVFSIPFVALFVAYFAFIPAVFAILISEILAKRDWLFYAIAGAVISLVIIGFMRGSVEAGNEAAADTNFVLALIGAGMCGGIGYWLVAGRSAGGWRDLDGATSPAP